jgi:hypothetical protein
MADAYVIEVAGHTAGIVARDHDREAFTFFASHRAFNTLEGKRFATPSVASRAARLLVEQADKDNARPAMRARAQEAVL